MAAEVVAERETVLMYQKQFDADVRRTTQDLKDNGVDDPFLENSVKFPTNVEDVRIIAEHLAAQAERITPDGIKPFTRPMFP